MVERGSLPTFADSGVASIYIDESGMVYTRDASGITYNVFCLAEIRFRLTVSKPRGNSPPDGRLELVSCCGGERVLFAAQVNSLEINGTRTSLTPQQIPIFLAKLADYKRRFCECCCK